MPLPPRRRKGGGPRARPRPPPPPPRPPAGLGGARPPPRFPHPLVIGFEPAGGAPDRAPVRAPHGRSDHAIALDFVEAMRGAPATRAEAALLQAAVDACCEDPDFDVLVST